MSEEESGEGIDLHPAPDVQLNEYERDLVRRVGFGLEAERFIESSIGQFIFSRASDVEMQSDVALRTVDATNVAAIVGLQLKAQAMGYLKQWLEEVVAIGIEAAREAEQPTE